MPRERDRTSKKIKVVDYDIEGNLIRAYYDSARELIFVLDETINADKPNVLLVIDSFDDRKWDDVLANDYGIDLETVRPKKDNKYQKLDIEYGGLDVYSELIDAYDADDDLADALENLKRFRIMSVRRAARERLDAATDTADKARETIERTNDTISELRSRLKDLRAKLAEQKRGIGREPTKTSASKILKTEAQIDATNEKLTRAKKRLDNARRRLAAAEDDAEIARAILARQPESVSTRRTMAAARRATKPAARVTRVTPEYTDFDEDDDVADEEYEETENNDAEADDMPNNDVKPLFDSDPNILDDNIAFKPIDFGTPETDSTPAPAPLSFTPPVDTAPTIETENNNVVAPMLDNLTSVSEPVVESEQIDVATNIEPVVAPVVEPVPVAEITPAETIETEPVVEPIAPVRPVSPITGYNSAVEPQTPKKPTLIYYLMLIVLIALSIFTLWLYQSKNGAVLPDLAATKASNSPVAEPAAVETNVPSPFVNTSVETVNTAVATAPVEPAKPAAEPIKETVIEEAPAPVAEPEPVAVVAAPESPVVEPVAVDVSVDAEPDNVVVESPFVDLRTVATYEPEKPRIPTEEEVLARKPGYGVSTDKKVFVAAPEYETESVATTVDIDETYSPDTDVQPMPINAPGNAPEIVASEVLETSVESEPETCAGGAPADENGCCPGENYMYTADGYMCCTDEGCMPPLGV